MNNKLGRKIIGLGLDGEERNPEIKIFLRRFFIFAFIAVFALLIFFWETIGLLIDVFL